MSKSGESPIHAPAAKGGTHWRSGSVQAPDGAVLGYSLRETAGSPEARIVLIHALAMDRTNWDGVIAALPESFAVLALDCRGHGIGRGESRLGLHLMADDIRILLDELGWKTAIVAGCSMGGCVAQAFASAYPQRTGALALIDTTSWYGEDAVSAWRGRAEKARTEGMAALVPFQIERWFTDGFRAADPEAVDSTLAVFLGNDLASYQAACAMLGEADLRSAVRTIDCPVTILVGEEDYATPIAAAEALQAAIAGSQLVVIEKARHFTPIERPETIAAALIDLNRRFLKSAKDADEA